MGGGGFIKEIPLKEETATDWQTDICAYFSCQSVSPILDKGIASYGWSNEV